MAKASKGTIETVVKTPGVTLELSEDEAYTLAAILCSIGGSPEGYRGQSQAVLSALSAAGYDWDNVQCLPIRKAFNGSGFFKDTR